MAIHFRTNALQVAETELYLLLADWAEKHRLTEIEQLGALNRVQGTILRTMLRDERHPDDPGKDVDEA